MTTNAIFSSAICAAAFTVAACSFSPAAQEDPEAKQRLDIMQAALTSLEPEASKLKKTALTPVEKPLLRYSDPTRGSSGDNTLQDATVWRLGAEGRPTALVTIELYQIAEKTQLLSFEFLSLTQDKFSLKHKTKNVRWDATASGLDLKMLPDAPSPAATAAARLTQMRQLMRRFSAKEVYRKDQLDLRLMVQPIDRYQSKADKIIDGTIFALANGTNPEIGIVLETDGERWHYGVLRMCAAEASVALDGKEIVAYEFFVTRGRNDGPFQQGFYKLLKEK